MTSREDARAAPAGAEGGSGVAAGGVPPRAEGLSTLAGRYDLAVCDVWGVIHNGIAIHPGAAEALVRFRAGGVHAGGRAVVLLTNAPRPGAVVARQLAAMGLPDAAYDAVVASGDVTRAEIGRRAAGAASPFPVFHLGPERDEPTFAGLPVARVEARDARLVVCTGLFHDEVETAEDYRERLSAFAARRVPMVCANPDRMVERGPRLIPCAGALAELYETLGGEVAWAGKPHAPAYDAALEAGRAAGASGSREATLAIGDAVVTDLAGAAGAELDALFVERGLHTHELGPDAEPDPARIARLLAPLMRLPVARMPMLRW